MEIGLEFLGDAARERSLEFTRLLPFTATLALRLLCLLLLLNAASLTAASLMD